ncbi:glr1492 [Gloeobacter violaceus PCC 7421]|uniref:Glr1492 protein n=2 Tax=Gloeobacter violaceus TaxID=33072 RepID=Q7NKI5_GLOVI|nr:glr1492 [Gloeobacter violaceus PCC 7421]
MGKIGNIERLNIRQSMHRRSIAVLLAGLLVAPGAIAAEPAAVPPADLEKQVLEIIQRHPEVVYNALRAYQSQAVRAQRRAEWQRQLENPVKVDLQGAPTLGPADAALTLVEFSDFQCPYCSRAQSTVKALLEKYKGRIRLVYLHLPLPVHSQAKAAALAAFAAGEQGKFFAYHDRLFALGEQLVPESFEQIARELNLDVARFNRDRESPQALARLEADLAQARRLELDATPSFVLNGIVLKGALPIEEFEEAIKLLQSKSG